MCAGVRATNASGGPAGGSLPELAGYALERELGRGGFATVYAGRRAADGLGLALKVGRADQPATWPLLLREAAALRAVGPPFVPRVFDEGRLADGSPYFALELVSAPTLAEVLEQREQAGPWADALAAALAIIEAASAVHARGMVHCDLKPENVFLLGSPVRALLFDFGLVMRRGETVEEPERAMAGTAEYMAPEQSEGRGADLSSRTDVYALGVMLYELLTGRVPFFGNAAEVKQAQVSHRPPAPSTLTRLPGAVEAVVLRCLAKDPAQRFEDAAALHAALEAAAHDHLPAPAPEAGPAPQSGARTAPAKQTVALLFFETHAEVGRLQATLAATGGELVFNTAPRVVAAFGGEASENPARLALRAAERLAAEQVSRRMLLDLGRVSVQTRADGSRRMFSPLFSRADRFPSPADAEGLLLTEAALAALADEAPLQRAARDGLHLAPWPTGQLTEPDATAVHQQGPPFVGREELMGALLQDARGAFAGQRPWLTLVAGESGSGKSRLCAELARALAALPALPAVTQLRLHEPIAGEPYRATRLLLRRVFGLTDAPAPSWEDALRAGPLGALSRDSALSLAVVMGWVAPDDAEVQRLAAAPGVLLNTASRAIGQGLLEMARARPLALVLDDAHFSDQAALGAVRYAAVADAQVPLLICAVARPGLERVLQGSGGQPPKALLALAPAAAEALCRALLQPAERVPAQAVARLVERSSSVPRLLVELVTRLKLDGLLRRNRKGDAWYLATELLDRVADLPLLEWVADRELRALPVELASHARLAAALGGEFRGAWLEGVQRELEQEGLGREFPLDAQVGLRRLVSAQVLVRHRDDQLSFRTGLLRDVVLASMPEATARRVHAAAARFYRERSTAPAEERLPRVALHAEKAGLSAEAAQLCLALADDLRRRHVYLDAEGLYGRSLALQPAAAQASRLRCLRGLGLMRHRLGRHEDALRDFAAARELAAALGDQLAQEEVLLDEATALDWMGDFSTSRLRAEEAARLAGATPAPALEATLLMTRARTLMRQSDYAGAVAVFEQAVTCAEAVGDPAYEDLVVSLLLLGPLYCMLDRMTEAERAFERAVAITSARQDRVHYSSVVNNRAMLWMARRDAGRAVADQREFLAIGRELGLADLEYRALGNLGELAYQLAELPDARRYGEQTLKLVESQGGPLDPRRAAALLLLARIDLLDGQLEAAQARVQAVRELQRQLKAGSGGAADLMPAEESFSRLIELATRGGTDAEWDALEAFSQQFGVQWDPVEVVEFRGRTALRLGRTEAAREALTRAIGLAEKLPNLLQARLAQALASA